MAWHAAQARAKTFFAERRQFVQGVFERCRRCPESVKSAGASAGASAGRSKSKGNGGFYVGSTTCSRRGPIEWTSSLTPCAARPWFFSERAKLASAANPGLRAAEAGKSTPSGRREFARDLAGRSEHLHLSDWHNSCKLAVHHPLTTDDDFEW